MFEELPDFPFLITMLILGMLSMVVALLIWSSFSLPHGRRRALLGCLAMGAFLVISARSVYANGSVSHWFFFPLLPSVPIVGVYPLTFPDGEKP
jgi:hypothetical protein